VRRVLERAHVFIAPFVELDSGDKDGIPTALLEAMATGAAVVTTNAGSIEEPVQHGVNGLVVPQRCPRALADAIATLHRDAGLRRRLGEAASRTVRARYDVRHCDALLHERMRSIMSGRQTAAATRRA
jgi:glycosyltransferase involved in cell wall biosynthesis